MINRFMLSPHISLNEVFQYKQFITILLSVYHIFNERSNSNDVYEREYVNSRYDLLNLLIFFFLEALESSDGLILAKGFAPVAFRFFLSNGFTTTAFELLPIMLLTLLFFFKFSRTDSSSALKTTLEDSICESCGDKKSSYFSRHSWSEDVTEISFIKLE